MNIIHYDLAGFCERALDVTESNFFAEAKNCVFHMVKDITLSSIEVTEQSEIDLHVEGFCFLAIYA